MNEVIKETLKRLYGFCRVLRRESISYLLSWKNDFNFGESPYDKEKIYNDVIVSLNYICRRWPKLHFLKLINHSYCTEERKKRIYIYIYIYIYMCVCVCVCVSLYNVYKHTHTPYVY